MKWLVYVSQKDDSFKERVAGNFSGEAGLSLLGRNHPFSAAGGEIMGYRFGAGL